MHTNPFATEAAHLRPTYPDELFAFLSSAVASREATGTHPTDSIKGDLARVWGDPEQKKDLHFPLYMRLRRV
jgi:hypothetical protein